jgi:glycosyltransferase involved in cell wall biosynthesis
MVRTVGRLAASEQYGGHDIMLDTWTRVRKKIPNAICCIVGDGNDRARLEARAGKLRVDDSVHFIGECSVLNSMTIIVAAEFLRYPLPQSSIRKRRAAKVLGSFFSR